MKMVFSVALETSPLFGTGTCPHAVGFLISSNRPAVHEVKCYLLRSLSAMIRVTAAKMPQTMPMKNALTGS